MFNKLVASTGSNKAWTFRTGAVSVAVHLVILLVILFSTRKREEAAPPPAKPEEVTYVDVTKIPEPEPEPEPDPEPEAPKPKPTPPQAAPRVPRVKPTTPKAHEMAGTQELKTPPKLTGIPLPDNAPAVKAEDFGGRGAIGGTAAGTAVAVPRADTTRTGSGVGRGQVDEGATYSSNMVDERAELLNRAQVARRLQQLYPPLLRDAGVAGSVSVQFVVLPNGHVEESSIKILSSTHDAFKDAALQIIQDLRFKPARVGSMNVRMLTVIPVRFKLE
ncbi:MAG TPA: TonB family protein [Longimicrobiales bacterium]|nr:TonB family protein [Longimicrobiales bacterium]